MSDSSAYHFSMIPTIPPPMRLCSCLQYEAYDGAALTDKRLIRTNGK